MKCLMRTMKATCMTTLAMCIFETLSFEERWVTRGPIEKEFPYAILILTSNDATEKSCTGSLLSERWVLTAARCMYRGNEVVENDTSLELYAGVINCSDLSGNLVQRRTSKKLEIFEESTRDNFHSIALVETAKDFHLSSPSLELGVDVISVNEYGFGSVKFPDGKSGSYGSIAWDRSREFSRIKKLAYKVQKCDCEKQLKEKFPGGAVSKWLCSRSKIDGVGECRGDLGLGLVCDQGLQAVSVGLVRFREVKSCEVVDADSELCGTPTNVGLYADLCWYLGWIHRRVPSVKYDKSTDCSSQAPDGKMGLRTLLLYVASIVTSYTGFYN